MMPEPLSEEDLEAMQARANAATPGPWHVRFLDDDSSMNLVAVSTMPDSEWREVPHQFEPGSIVAATLVQRPRYADIADERWDENAEFIAGARSDVPRLVAEVRRLRNLLNAP